MDFLMQTQHVSFSVFHIIFGARMHERTYGLIFVPAASNQHHGYHCHTDFPRKEKHLTIELDTDRSQEMSGGEQSQKPSMKEAHDRNL